MSGITLMNIAMLGMWAVHSFVLVCMSSTIMCFQICVCVGEYVYGNIDHMLVSACVCVMADQLYFESG